MSFTSTPTAGDNPSQPPSTAATVPKLRQLGMERTGIVDENGAENRKKSLHDPMNL
uniref:Uncharacterized protein n=1 Tax=Solanum lycopersicum TaxID=4081 RepID=A0A3Q7FZQ1_SOLLC